MKEFEVTITETLQKTVSIEAETKDEAKQLIEDMWKNSEIILDADDFADVEYTADKGKEISKANEMDVLVCRPGQYAEMATIKSDLSSMQELVGGHIQAIYPFDEPVAIVCNDEGKISGAELNRAVKDDNGKVVDIVAGTFFVCGLGDEDFKSLQPEHKAKFEKMFKNPEAFLKMGKGIMAIPIEPRKQTEKKALEPKKQGQEL